MNSKTKHRLLGVLVLAGLVVIILPFMQSGRELSSNATAIKDPAFPDQSVQLTIPNSEQEQSSTQVAQQSVEPETPVQVAAAEPATTATEVDVKTASKQPEEVKNSPDDTIKNDHPIEPTKAAPPIESKTEINTETKTETKSESEPEDTTSMNATPSAKTEAKVAPTETPKTTSKKATQHVSKKVQSKKSLERKSVKNNDLFNIQDPAWVIQVGSFNNKTSALKVVNQLRAHGYKAFIQQFSANTSDSTRVFVGPENKQTQARAIAQELKSRMHLHGIVISYQPLAG